MDNNSGFSLIELLVVITILALLSVLTFPLYENYVLKTQVTRGYGEMNSLRTAVEVCESDGSLGPTCSLDNVVSSLYLQTPTVTFRPSKISAVFGNQAHPKLRGGTVELNRGESSAWVCTITFPNAVSPSVIPKECRNAPTE